MTRIAYFVHGRGKGHAVRTRAIVAKLPDRYRLRLFCAGAAWRLLEDLPQSEPVLACAPGRGMIRAFAVRMRQDLKRLRGWQPDILVSDGDGPSVNAAKVLGIPVVSIGHGLIFHHTHLQVALPPRKHWREVVNAASSSWPAVRRVAVHFAPVEPRTAGTYVARPDLPSIEPSSRREDFILAYFRDDNGFEMLDQLVRAGHRAVVFGKPKNVPAGVEVHAPDVPAFAEALGRCRAVVGSAGNHLPAECAMLGLPMLALYRNGDAEHEMNARLVEAAGIGIGGTFEHCTPNLIQRFEAELDRPRDELAARTRAMLPASEVVPRVIDELSAQANAAPDTALAGT